MHIHIFTKCSFVKECVRDLCKICVDGTDMNNCVEAIKTLNMFSGMFLSPIERTKLSSPTASPH